MQSWVAFSEVLRNLGIVVGGAIGIVLAWQRVMASNKQAEAQLRQAELSRRSHVTELFNRAVGQLKDERLEIRLGAILTLGQVCRDFSDLAEPVIQLLATHPEGNAGELRRRRRASRHCRNRADHCHLVEEGATRWGRAE